MTNTAKIMAHVARFIILFFTFTIVLQKMNTKDIEIIDDFMIHAVLVGFIAAVSLAAGLAFGLGWTRVRSETCSPM